MSVESLLDVGKDIVDVLDTDGETDRTLLDALDSELLFGILGVSRGSRVDSKGLNVSYVSKEREDLELIDELLSFLSAALDLESEDDSAAVRIVLLVKSLLGRIGRYRRVIYLCNLGVVIEELYYLKSILYVTLYSKGKCLKSLKEYESVYGR